MKKLFGVLPFLCLWFVADAIAEVRQGSTLGDKDWNILLTGPDGLKTRLSDYKGQVIWLDFWASWCGPCRHEFPWLEKQNEKFSKNGFRVLAVSVDEEVRDMSRFLEQMSTSFPVFHDPRGEVAEYFGIKGMPSGVLIDRTGRVVKKHTGFRQQDAASLEELIATVLGRSGAE